MIIAITLIAGLVIFTIQIILYEIHRQIEQIKAELDQLTKDGGMYPKAKAVKVAELSRTVWIKPAPLYHVIKR